VRVGGAHSSSDQRRGDNSRPGVSSASSWSRRST
jgi:hypothetical protein